MKRGRGVGSIQRVSFLPDSARSFGNVRTFYLVDVDGIPAGVVGGDRRGRGQRPRVQIPLEDRDDVVARVEADDPRLVFSSHARI